QSVSDEDQSLSEESSVATPTAAAITPAMARMPMIGMPANSLDDSAVEPTRSPTRAALWPLAAAWPANNRHPAVMARTVFFMDSLPISPASTVQRRLRFQKRSENDLSDSADLR